jgi:hypothetical protein
MRQHELMLPLEQAKADEQLADASVGDAKVEGPETQADNGKLIFNHSFALLFCYGITSLKS